MSSEIRKRQEKTNFNVNPFSFNVENRLSRHIEQFVSPHRTVCFNLWNEWFYRKKLLVLTFETLCSIGVNTLFHTVWTNCSIACEQIVHHCELMDYPYLEHECTVHRGWPYTRFRGLQILYLQGICKGYLQAHNTLVCSEASTKSLQMADKMRKKTLCSGAGWIQQAAKSPSS